jgi:type IV pilus assembly protein PilY1
MKRPRNPLLRSILLLLPCAVLALAGGSSEAAVLEQYCQYPPYVIQTVLPSVTLLVSNSQSMLNFAYGDGSKACDSPSSPCGGFDSSTTYYGLFNSNYWYTAPAGGGAFTQASLAGGTLAAPTGRGTDDWHGNFLNWLTTRRVDAMKKVLTGGTGDGIEACGGNSAIYKRFGDNRTFTPYNNPAEDVTFNYRAGCTGTLKSQFTIGSGGSAKTWDVTNSSIGTTSGIIQEVTPKASLGLAFYNDSDSQGASIDPQIDGGNLPIVAYRNRIDTPSRFNGMTVGQPLGEALWTIVGQYARDSTSAATGPRYHNGDYNPSKDPYTFHGSPSRCVKGSVIIISDGEPCNDGSLPTSYAGFNILNYADGTTFNCQSGNCLAGGIYPATTIPSCAAGGAVGGLEDVALFAHTRDLRNSPTFGVDNLANKQNLDIFVIRAFGSDNSNLLKYAAINGSFDDANGNGVPDAGEYSTPGTQGSAYFQADDGSAIETALRDIFVNILKRATSGTAASVLASGEGSGANLVQAVFYPRRRFFDEVVEWTGTLQNLWYYVDLFFGSASIREDSDKSSASDYTPVLNLATDNTIEFFFDQATQTTKANEFANSSTTGNKTGTAAVVPFEQVHSIWEAGSFLHSGSASSRTIFTAIDSAVPRTKLPFNDNNASTVSTLVSWLAAASDNEATNIIRYVRGMDDVDSDGVIDYRQRTVPYPANSASDNTTWKLGDIINSTPKIASRVPLNTYDRTYNDTTYRDFTRSSVYLDRGMVFVGANDGMLHAFKLGKLEFPGDNTWTTPAAMDKVRLRNLDTSVPLGQERWAFIPKNALPYLKAMLDNNYCHLYYVDQASQLFDASIGPPTGFVADNATRTSASWRTILIGGMRLGGACAVPSSGRPNAVDLPVSGIGYSSYFAIDVTNPESPSVLWEFSDPALGFATTGPAIVRVNAVDRTKNGKWFVVFGSGPTGPISNRQFFGKSDQTLKLFVVDLKTGALLQTIEPRDSANAVIANAFAGSMINATADFNLDYEDDALYLGYVRENAGVWNQGGVLRLQTKGDVNPANWAASTLIENVGPVTSSVVRLQSNTYNTSWLFFGSGRYYFATPSLLDDELTQRKLFGVKEPCFTSLNTINPACTMTVDPGTLTSVGDTTTIAEGTANVAGFPGWSIDLDTTVSVNYDGTGFQTVKYQAERVITDPLATSSGLVFFTTFRPYGEDCAIGGRTFLWAVRYNTGGAPAYALQGKALMQVSTASVEQLDLSSAFSGNDTIHRGGRRSFALEGVPPTAQGLSLLSPPPPVRRILHMKER